MFHWLKLTSCLPTFDWKGWNDRRLLKTFAHLKIAQLLWHFSRRDCAFIDCRQMLHRNAVDDTFVSLIRKPASSLYADAMATPVTEHISRMITSLWQPG